MKIYISEIFLKKIKNNNYILNVKYKNKFLLKINTLSKYFKFIYFYLKFIFSKVFIKYKSFRKYLLIFIMFERLLKGGIFF